MGTAPGYQPYVIREGDTVSELSFRRGADPNQVWNVALNAELKKSRCHMDLLHPGDLIYLPPAKTKYLPVRVGTVNRFVATPFVHAPYPPIVLGQSSGDSNIQNLLIRICSPCMGPIAKLVVNGSGLVDEKDYFESEIGVFFRPPGEFAGSLEGAVTFEGRPEYRFALPTATAIAQEMESIFAQSLNVRALARAVRLRMTAEGRTASETASFVHSLFLTAFYARQSTLDALEKNVAGATDWALFCERTLELPALSD